MKLKNEEHLIKKKKNIYIYIWIYEKCYVHNIFTTNHKWQVVISKQKNNFYERFNYNQ